MEKSETAEKNRNSVREWVIILAVALMMTLAIRALVFESFTVRMSSMEPTLDNGQRVLVFKTPSFISPPAHGDIVVLQYQEGISNLIPFLTRIPQSKRLFTLPGEICYVKRVIGVPGEQINLREGRVWINGKVCDEPYTQGATYSAGDLQSYPVTVPPHKVFVLGDNRENSSDSREFGFVDIDQIKGRVVLIL